MDEQSAGLETQLHTMRTQISGSLEKARKRRNTLKRKNSRYTTTNILLSALSTLLAGMAGTIGNAQNWKATCLFASICSAGVTVITKLQTAERLTEASECIGQLKSLKFETLAPTYDLQQVTEKYEQILSDFSIEL